MTTPEARRLRLCDVCGQLDDHPRHVQGVPPGFPGAVPSDEFIANLAADVPPYAVVELTDPTTIVRHQDCCAAQGCLICKETEAANGGARGDALLASIQAGAVDHLSGSRPDTDTAAEA